MIFKMYINLYFTKSGDFSSKISPLIFYKNKQKIQINKPKFEGIGVNKPPATFHKFTKPGFKGPTNFNTAFRTQNKGAK